MTAVSVTAGASGSATPPEGVDRGRTAISSRALNSVARAVAAEALDVSARAVRIDLADIDGLLGVTVRSPLRMAALASIRRSEASASPSAVQRAEEAQRLIHDRVRAITGAQIAHVTVRLTGASIEDTRRVQ